MHGLCNVQFPVENPVTVCPGDTRFAVHGQTDMRKLIVSFDNEAKALKDTAP